MISLQTLGTYRRVAAGTAFFTGHDAVRLSVRKLLSEREDLLAQIKRWEDKEVHRASCCSDNEEKAAAAVALLREVEWAGGGPDGESECPVCGVERGFSTDPSPAHAPDCRLAAFLGRK